MAEELFGPSRVLGTTFRTKGCPPPGALAGRSTHRQAHGNEKDLADFQDLISVRQNGEFLGGLHPGKQGDLSAL